MKVPHGEGLANHPDQAARATSAAPTFFPGHGGDDYVFLDGSVWANDPIMTVVVDVLSAYDVSREQIEVFSLGTGPPV